VTRRLVAVAAAALLGGGLVVASPSAPATAAPMTLDYQCLNDAYGATEIRAAMELEVTITMPSSVTAGGATDFAQVAVAAVSGGELPLSPQVALDDVDVSLAATLEVVDTAGALPPPVSTPGVVQTGSTATSSIGDVAPSAAWPTLGPVPVSLNIPGVSGGDRLWVRPSTLTYAWSAASGAGSTTCVPVDASAIVSTSTVENPIVGIRPAVTTPYGGQIVVSSAPVPPDDYCELNPGDPSCDINQQLDLEVEPGTLSLSQTGGSVLFDPVTLDGANQVTTADLNELTIVDARGTDAPWTLTASVTDFAHTTSSTGNITIPGSNLAWSPTCTVVEGVVGSVSDGGSGQFVPVSGSVNGTPITASRVLCDHEGTTGGGTWTAAAEMTLTVPPTIKVGDYQATLFLTIA
jgi:hypothetical protein